MVAVIAHGCAKLSFVTVDAGAFYPCGNAQIAPLTYATVAGVSSTPVRKVAPPQRYRKALETQPRPVHMLNSCRFSLHVYRGGAMVYAGEHSVRWRDDVL